MNHEIPTAKPPESEDPVPVESRVLSAKTLTTSARISFGIMAVLLVLIAWLHLGTLVLMSVFALLCHVASRTQHGRRPMTIARLLLVMFLFLVPYWGVFYFRFSIANGFIVVNLAFIAFVWLLQKFGSALPVRSGRIAVPMRPVGHQ